MKAEVRAKYITKWDDGRTILESPCKVNLITHKILHIGRRKIICSPYPNRVLDDYVEHLDAEYVRFADGTCCNVVDYQSTCSSKICSKSNGSWNFYL